MRSLLPHPPSPPGLSPLFRRLPSSPLQSSTQASLSLGIPSGLIRSPVKCFYRGPSFLSWPPHCAKDALRCERPSHACPLPLPSLSHCGLACRAQDPAHSAHAGPDNCRSRVQRDSVMVELWAGLSLCGCGVLTEAQLEEAEHLSGSPEGPSRAEVGTRQRLSGPAHPSPAPQGTAPTSPPASPARTQQRLPWDPRPRCDDRSPRWSRY